MKIDLSPYRNSQATRIDTWPLSVGRPIRSETSPIALHYKGISFSNTRMSQKVSGLGGWGVISTNSIFFHDCEGTLIADNLQYEVSSIVAFRYRFLTWILIIYSIFSYADSAVQRIVSQLSLAILCSCFPLVCWSSGG